MNQDRSALPLVTLVARVIVERVMSSLGEEGAPLLEQPLRLLRGNALAAFDAMPQGAQSE